MGCRWHWHRDDWRSRGQRGWRRRRICCSHRRWSRGCSRLRRGCFRSGCRCRRRRNDGLWCLRARHCPALAPPEGPTCQQHDGHSARHPWRFHSTPGGWRLRHGGDCRGPGGCFGRFRSAGNGWRCIQAQRGTTFFAELGVGLVRCLALEASGCVRCRGSCWCSGRHGAAALFAESGAQRIPGPALKAIGCHGCLWTGWSITKRPLCRMI